MAVPMSSLYSVPGCLLTRRRLSIYVVSSGLYVGILNDLQLLAALFLQEW